MIESSISKNIKQTITVIPLDLNWTRSDSNNSRPTQLVRCNDRNGVRLDMAPTRKNKHRVNVRDRNLIVRWILCRWFCRPLRLLLLLLLLPFTAWLIPLESLAPNLLPEARATVSRTRSSSLLIVWSSCLGPTSSIGCGLFSLDAGFLFAVSMIFLYLNCSKTQC